MEGLLGGLQGRASAEKAHRDGVVSSEALHVAVAEGQLPDEPRRGGVPIEHHDVVRLQHLRDLARDVRHLLLDCLAHCEAPRDEGGEPASGQLRLRWAGGMGREWQSGRHRAALTDADQDGHKQEPNHCQHEPHQPRRLRLLLRHRAAVQHKQLRAPQRLW